MARRSLADARQWLDDRAKHLNPEAYRQYDQEIQAAETKAKQRAEVRLAQDHDRYARKARKVSEEMCNVRDRARELADKINTGRISAADAATELDKLRSDARRHRTASTALVRHADVMDVIEADPVAHSERVAQSMPYGRGLSDFSF